MNKLQRGPFTQMYLILVSLLVIVSLTGFVTKGKSVTITVDGQTNTVFTRAVNTEALLREENISLGPNDEAALSTPTLKSGSTLEVHRAVPVMLIFKDKSKVVETAKQTAQDVAEQYGYDRKNYRVYGDPSMKVQKGMWIHVGTLSKKQVTEDEVIPYTVESVPDDNLAQGEEQLIQEGINGRRTVKTNIVSLDGEIVGKEIISSSVIAEMKPMIRHIGTRATVEVSRGNISRYRAVFSMEATAYLPTDGSGEGITATGIPAHYGVVAVDPHVIPLGSRVFVPGYGEAIAADTGSAIVGNRIDLCMEDYGSCMQFGRRSVEVYILN
ncbi:MAG: G5 domain-containing protein [Megasphaera sp.]|jgi:uncharacterized protein YabE (DUF348 family)|nr:G5 domain-containing protein [Megasphaera sp.]